MLIGRHISTVREITGMDQPVIVVHRSLKRLPAPEIAEDFRAILRPDAVAYGTVARYLHDAHCPPSIAEAIWVEVQSSLDDSDRAILSALEENPFASVRQLSWLTHTPATSVYRCLTEPLGFVARLFRLVPRT
jgi:DNA-binding Lrp family transcriptional regulator